MGSACARSRPLGLRVSWQTLMRDSSLAVLTEGHRRLAKVSKASKCNPRPHPFIWSHSQAVLQSLYSCWTPPRPLGCCVHTTVTQTSDLQTFQTAQAPGDQTGRVF